MKSEMSSARPRVVERVMARVLLVLEPEAVGIWVVVMVFWVGKEVVLLVEGFVRDF